MNIGHKKTENKKQENLNCADLTLIIQMFIGKLKLRLPLSLFLNFRLTHFSPVLHFYTSRKQHKTLRFSDVFKGI